MSSLDVRIVSCWLAGRLPKFCGLPLAYDGKLVGDEAADAGDPLLAVEHLEHVRADLVEVDQSERVALQERLNDRLLALLAALGVDVVPLILRLNREFPRVMAATWILIECGLIECNTGSFSDMKVDAVTKFGHRVRALRERAGISQETLASRAGIHRTYMGGVERGERNVSLKNILRIAEALGVAPQKLFDEDKTR